ncbi:unnamed protein product [Rotaria sp. Silwood1]|nr:unnamed protein product [Rotaria sp. Silwood1]
MLFMSVLISAHNGSDGQGGQNGQGGHNDQGGQNGQDGHNGQGGQNGRDDDHGRGNDHRNNRCGDLAGVTFQIRINYGSFSAYEVVQFHADHTTTSIDNTQNGFSPQAGVEPQPFSAQLGEWKCVGRNRVEVRTANYNFQVTGSSTPSTVVINILILNFIGNSDFVSGTIRFDYFALNSFINKANPRPLPGQSFGPFPVNGRRFNFFRR